MCMVKQFRFSAERIFLTYSQTPVRLRPQVVLKYFNKKWKKIGVVQYLISQESHSKGGKHIHAYFKFGKKLDSKNTDFMDLQYYGKKYHPNIRKVVNVHQLWKYIKKDKPEIDWISNIEETRPLWEVNLQESRSKKEFLENMMWMYADKNLYIQYRIAMDLWKIKESDSYSKRVHVVKGKLK